MRAVSLFRGGAGYATPSTRKARLPLSARAQAVSPRARCTRGTVWGATALAVAPTPGLRPRGPSVACAEAQLSSLSCFFGFPAPATARG